jgi:hypothetical protein
LNALLFDSKLLNDIAYPMSLPVLRLDIMLLANRTLSMMPELTPRPAIGWIEWAASPIRAIRWDV